MRLGKLGTGDTPPGLGASILLLVVGSFLGVILSLLFLAVRKTTISRIKMPTMISERGMEIDDDVSRDMRRMAEGTSDEDEDQRMMMIEMIGRRDHDDED